MKGGVEVKVDVYVPTFLMDYEISESVWETAIGNFNKKLAARPSVTTHINGIDVDILRIETLENAKDYFAMGAVLLYMIVRPEQVESILDIHFIISGFVTFEETLENIVDGMKIENITYGGDDSKKFKVLKEKC